MPTISNRDAAIAIVVWVCIEASAFCELIPHELLHQNRVEKWRRITFDLGLAVFLLWSLFRYRRHGYLNIAQALMRSVVLSALLAGTVVIPLYILITIVEPRPAVLLPLETCAYAGSLLFCIAFVEREVRRIIRRQSELPAQSA